MPGLVLCHSAPCAPRRCYTARMMLRILARTLLYAVPLAATVLLGACATAEESVEAFDRGQHDLSGPVLEGERIIEDTGAAITGTEPAYKKGGTFFVMPDSKDAFGTN